MPAKARKKEKKFIDDAVSPHPSCRHEHDDPERSSQDEGGSRCLGDDAAAFLALCTDANSGNESSQEAALRIWGDQAGKLISERAIESLELVSDQTSEAKVFYDPTEHRAWKKTWPGTFGFIPRKINQAWKPCAATPLEMLNRWRLQNDIFDDDIRLEGVSISESPSMVIGQSASGVSLIFSQPWIDAKNPEEESFPTETEIVSLMQSLGFTSIPNAFYGWSKDDIVILDAKPDNFIKSVAGIIPIDLQIVKVAPDSDRAGLQP